KKSIRGGEIFEVRLERADIDRRAMRNVLRNTEIVGDLLHRVEPCELPDAYAHGIARMDQSIGARHGAAVSAIGISGRPISCALDLARLNRAIADCRTRQ